MATLIAGLLLVAALSTVGTATQGQILNAERTRAGLLADALMVEIVELPYGDPQGGEEIGPDDGEQTSVRTDFDDVDDYHNWTATPPMDKDGTELSSGWGLTRSVTVSYVDPDNLDDVDATDTGAKRIIVSVASGTKTLASMVAVVTDY